MKLITDLVRYNWHVTTSSLLLLVVGFQIAVLALIGDLVGALPRELTLALPPQGRRGEGGQQEISDDQQRA